MICTAIATSTTCYSIVWIRILPWCLCRRGMTATPPKNPVGTIEAMTKVSDVEPVQASMRQEWEASSWAADDVNDSYLSPTKSDYWDRGMKKLKRMESEPADTNQWRVRSLRRDCGSPSEQCGDRCLCVEGRSRWYRVW